MDEKINGVELFAGLLENAVQIFVLAHVACHQDRIGHADGFEGFARSSLILGARQMRKRTRCSFTDQSLGDMASNATVIGDSKDQAPFSVQQTH